MLAGLLSGIIEGVLKLAIIGGLILFIMRQGKKDQQLDDAKESKKLQKKIDNVVPIKPSELDDTLDKGEF